MEIAEAAAVGPQTTRASTVKFPTNPRGGSSRSYPSVLAQASSGRNGSVCLQTKKRGSHVVGLARTR